MRIPRIYTKQSLSEDALIYLEESSSHHLSKVLRMQRGSELVLFNGQGLEYPAVIESIAKKSVAVKTSTSLNRQTESPLITHLAIGISRGERFDFVLQKASELGINKITPLFTERTEVKIPKERLNKKMHSWQQIVVSSCEQNHRNTLPIVQPVTNIQDFLNTIETSSEQDDLRLVLHHRTQKKLSDHKAPSRVTLLIGPEGGLSDGEILLAESKNFNALALGPRVLRTETAPIVALSCMQLLWGDF